MSINFFKKKKTIFLLLGDGLKNMWTKISDYAQKLWEDMGYNIDEQEILVAQMLNFKAKEGTYATPFSKNRITPRTWWMSCEDEPPFVKQLALKMFAVTPHSASCERMFSVLGWLYGKRRTTLDISTIESLAKIRHFYQNNMLSESKKRHDHHNGPDDLQQLVNESTWFEDEADEENEEDNNNDSYEEYFEEIQIPNHDIYVLIENYVDLAKFSEN